MRKKYDPHFIADILGCPIAMSADGVWRWYKTKPIISGGIWIEKSSSIGTLPDGVIDYNGDWQDSLALPGYSISIPGNETVLQNAVDFRFRWSNRIDSYLKDGYQLVGDLVERNKRFYRSLVKLNIPPVCPLTGYKVVKAAEANTYITDEWNVASAPFKRSDGEIFVELIKR